MSGDFSRITFDVLKHYSSVLMQQGRVQMDADWNEQASIQRYRDRMVEHDTIGKCGVPKRGSGFAVSVSPANDDLLIGAGRSYADGLICENEVPWITVIAVTDPLHLTLQTVYCGSDALSQGQWLEITDQEESQYVVSQMVSADADTGAVIVSLPIAGFASTVGLRLRPLVSYKRQPHYPNPDTSAFNAPASPPSSPPGGSGALADGTYLAYLEAWQDSINHWDDPRIKEPALGEADTAERLKTFWRMHLEAIGTSVTSPASGCEVADEVWKTIAVNSTGRMTARTKEPDPAENPCLLPSTSGYKGLENQLYRVQIHQGGSLVSATFKWSRDNGFVESPVENIDGDLVTVTELGKDETLSFAPGQWVEFIDDTVRFGGTVHPLVKIKTIEPSTRVITLYTSADAYKNLSNLRLRRWDQAASASGIALSAAWTDLESGIQVKFEEGTYQSGDYWVFAARTATGEIEWPPFEIPNEHPLPVPPMGVRRAYCRLAIVQVTAGAVSITDCREKFPSLTDLEASDIEFDNASCDLPGAETVQDALEQLCAVRDLREHNKFVHGSGVVCGLKVHCNYDDRMTVHIGPGYALDCEGYGIRLVSEITYDVVARAMNAGLLTVAGDGTVLLSIASDASGGRQVSVEPFVNQGFWQEIFEGTLLKDFYDENIEPFWLMLKSQFPSGLSDAPPVPLAQQHLTTVLNIAFQLMNSLSGPYMFLSRKEYDILKDLFDLLRVLLASSTFCAIFDKDRPFPAYTLDEGLDTLFGPSIRLHHRIVVHPSRPIAYTFGLGNAIYVYNLDTKTYIEKLTFPAGDTVVIKDLALISGQSRFVALGVIDNKDSIFATADINADNTHFWGSSSVSCGIAFCRLAIGPAPAATIYATAQARGLYRITNIGNPTYACAQLRQFNATGLLTISASGDRLFAAEAQFTPVGTVAANFTRIIGITASSPSGTAVNYVVLGADAENDLLVEGNTLYVTGLPPAGQTKSVYSFAVATGSQTVAPIDILYDSPTRLATATVNGSSKQILVTLSDRYKVSAIDVANHTLDNQFRIPVQTYPLDIEVRGSTQKAYVVNLLLNTVTEIDLQTVFDPLNQPNITLEPPTEISSMRQEIVDAYSDLLSHFLQYFKDAFCEQFLIDCPSCGPQDKVYLGTVQIKERKVYKICNFTKRHYVKNFDTVGYWLSTVPIIPLLKKLFKEFCCSVI
jgi:hypothetical protein